MAILDRIRQLATLADLAEDIGDDAGRHVLLAEQRRWIVIWLAS